MTRRRPALVSVLLMMGCAAAQAGVVEPYAPNTALIIAEATHLNEGGAPDVSNHEIDQATASVPGELGYRNTVTANPPALLPPGGGGAKDGAQGQLAVHFDTGAGAAPDRLCFDFSGAVSNLSGNLAPGVPATFARTRLQGTVAFYLDPIFTGLPSDTVVGSLSLAALRAAQPFESFKLRLLDRSATVLTLLPGGSAGNADLRLGHDYPLVFNHEMAVPDGFDPPFFGSFSGAITAVPELASLSLMLAGLLGLGSWCWARRHPWLT